MKFITENNLQSKQETIMKLINKIIALFSNMNISFGTFNH
ncbi:hypothetical protein H650_15130 [Enterobacter sp. R4-368]|nr:hypothetical protein H650_15130 [Enterobacter sp. R4-368]